MKKHAFRREDFASDNEILFEGYSAKPKLPVTEIVIFVLVVLISVTVDGFMIGSSAMTGIIKKTPATKALVFIAAFLVHAIPEAVWAMNIVKKYAFAKHTYYIVTEKKIVVIYDFETVECKIFYLENLTAMNRKEKYLQLTFGEENEKLYGLSLSDEIFSVLTAKNL